MDLRNPRRDRNDIFQLNVSGKIIDFQLCTNKKRAMASYQESENESVIVSIQNYLLDFFGSSMQYHWRFGYLQHYFIPRLKNVSFCIDICLEEDLKEMEKLETFFSSSPVFKWIGLKTMSTIKPFTPESKLYQAESIRISQFWDNFSLSAILRHFKGRQATVMCDRWENSEELIEFVNRWKSGEAFQKLEHLKFKFNRNEILDKGFLNEIGVKCIDATKQPPTHTLPKVYNWYYQQTEPTTDPIISHTYVVRATDNRVASILIQEDMSRSGEWIETIYFGVWDKTEEEFLKLID
ncbi:hypothetical protein B9Z55_000760 [Caenorhabditis nigoni]|nr:hypothetical protein B9Z55_000760 [Caenorhabditis nigoni]